MGTLVGHTLGRFRVDRLIGKGGMGAVYAAFDEKLERDVALKALIEKPTDPQQRKRFLREARLAAKLTHPNIATVYEVDELDGQLLIVMELLEGQSLRALLARRRLSVDEALDIARDVARALARAHQAGVTHRDIKPENVFLTQPSPGSTLAKVLDFGLARQRTPKPAGQEHTATDTTTAGAMWGTPGYLSPEQAHGKSADAQSDVFSFGVLFYEMLTGRRAFKGDNAVALLLAVAKKEPEAVRTYVPNLRPEIEDILVRCLKKEKAERFVDGTELAAALDALDRSSGPAVRATESAPVDKDPEGEAPTAPHSNEDLAEVAQTEKTEKDAISHTPLATTNEVPTFERLRRQKKKMGIAIAAGAAGLLLVVLLVSTIASHRSNESEVAAEAALPAAPPPPASVTAPPAPVETTIELGAESSASAAPAHSAPPHVVRPRAKGADCAQPFTIDSKGVKIPKLQCL